MKSIFCLMDRYCFYRLDAERSAPQLSTIVAQTKKDWHGTLTLVAQPAEERGMGAKNMVLTASSHAVPSLMLASSYTLSTLYPRQSRIHSGIRRLERRHCQPHDLRQRWPRSQSRHRS